MADTRNNPQQGNQSTRDRDRENDRNRQVTQNRPRSTLRVTLPEPEVHQFIPVQTVSTKSCAF